MVLDIAYIQEQLNKEFADSICWQDNSDMPTVVVDSSINEAVIRFLHDREDIAIRFLTDITAVHYPDEKGKELCVVYHLHQLRANVKMRIKCYLSIENPNINSVVGVYDGANWMERETYDFYGVNFINHPNLKRILNVDEMDYFPMRKEYPMEDPTRMDKDDEMFGRGGSDLF